MTFQVPANLFSPLKQRSVTFPNRIVCSPMCQYSSEDGFASDWHLVHLGTRAVGGAGTVLTEAAAVSPEGRISPQDLGIWKDEHITKMTAITRFIKGQGSVPGIQLAHAGRKASMARPWEPSRVIPPAEAGWEPVLGPSSEPYSEKYPTPQAMDRNTMVRVIADFAAAARRAAEAGFLVAEVHAAHGYLLHEFLSPLSNQRTDQYGGPIANRMRFPLEVVRAVRAVFPEHLPVWVRVSATDWVDGGLTVDETVEFCKQLKTENIDLVDVSSGGNDPRQQIPTKPGYQVPFSECIRRETGLPTGAVGLITDPAQANRILHNEQADFVLLAREMLRDPYWPMRAAKELGQVPSWPAQYERAAGEKVQRRHPLSEVTES